MSTVSTVFFSRNDNYTPNMEHRVLLAIQSSIISFDEVVYVDWCSPNDVTFIEAHRDQIPKTGKLKCVKVTEKQLREQSDIQNFFNPANRATVWNIGIRRATSDFILSTAGDVITERPDVDSLDANTMYTVARMAVPEMAHLQYSDVTALREMLFANFTQFQRSPDSVSHDGQAIWDPEDVWTLVVCCGDFLLAHRNVWNTIKAFEQSMTVAMDSNIMKKAHTHGFNRKKLYTKAYHLDHQGSAGGGVPHDEYMKQYYANVVNFGRTNNPDDWGLANINFETEVI